jgi:hypothetical protein
MKTFMYADSHQASAADYLPTAADETTTYHWDSNRGYGQGFSSEEEALADWREQHDGDPPEIYELGSEWEGLQEAGGSILDPEEYCQLCLEELDFDPVIFEHCPRGFANEVSFLAVPEAQAQPYRDDLQYEEISEAEFFRRSAYGIECHASDRADGTNTYQNPSCGSYGINQ